MEEFQFTTIIYIATVLMLIAAALVLLSSSSKEKRYSKLLGWSILSFIIGASLLFLELVELREVFAALATLVVAAVAIIALIQNRKLAVESNKREQRDRTERILNIIIEWADEIHTSSLRMEIPKIDQSLAHDIEENAIQISGEPDFIKQKKDTILEDEQRRSSLQNLQRHSIPFSRKGYIRALAIEYFNDNPILNENDQSILNIIDDVIVNLTLWFFLENKRLGIDLRKSLSEDNPIFTELDNRLETEKLYTILQEYGDNLALAINNLYKLSAKILSNK